METGAAGEQDRGTGHPAAPRWAGSVAPGSVAPGSVEPEVENQAGGARAAAGMVQARRDAETGAVTGEGRVDAALARLDELADLPVTEHREVFEHIHRSLTEILGELETPGLPVGQPDGRG